MEKDKLWTTKTVIYELYAFPDDVPISSFMLM